MRRYPVTLEIRGVRHTGSYWVAEDTLVVSNGLKRRRSILPLEGDLELRARDVLLAMTPRPPAQHPTPAEA